MPFASFKNSQSVIRAEGIFIIEQNFERNPRELMSQAEANHPISITLQ